MFVLDRGAPLFGALPLVFAAAAAAQPAPSAPTQQVVITGNPLAGATLANPVSTLSGDALVLHRASTLGETLDGLPGVSSSYFGPNANRPVIRGLDGDRIRMLNNSGASLDASALSFDHAVPIDPLAVERIEVLRGPAALMYGGSAVGGVVNAIDNRIPQTALAGLEGAAELRLGGAAAERGASALVEGGAGGFAWHTDAFWRDTGDLRVPTFDRPTGDGSERSNRVVNSAGRADGGAVGGSAVWDHGHFGLSADTYRNRYGTVAEDDVTITMQRDRIALAGEVRDLDGPIVKVRGQLAGTDYRHVEFEGSAVGTTFETRGSDARLELEHRAWALGTATLRGVFGLQSEDARFSALGEEAFVPSTHTRQQAGFVFEELSVGTAKLSFGVRAEDVRVDSAGDGDGADADAPVFGPAAARRFTPLSGALGALWSPAPPWQLSANLARTERAPTFYELYANGLHVATAAFERGDPTLGIERGTQLDLALQWRASRDDHLRIGVFENRFANYVSLADTGDTVADPENGEALPVFAYRAVPARFYGLEAEGGWRATAQLAFDAKLDWVRASNCETGEPLPRIAPLRVTLGADAALAGWTLRAEAVHAARQERVPQGEAETPGYTLLNLAASRPFDLGGHDALFFAKLGNVTDRLAYNAATIATVRPLSPLPGRALLAGLRVSF